MPKICVRAHGVSASNGIGSNRFVVNPVTGEVVKLTAPKAPERSETGGWSRAVARRNEQRLQSVDFDAIDGEPAFVTLTMPRQQMSEVSSQQFHRWLHKWLGYMQNRGCIHYYWILEFQSSGNPHLHVIVWLSDWLTGGEKRGYKRHEWDVLEQYKAKSYWVNMLNSDGICAKVSAQDFQTVELGKTNLVDGEKLVSPTPERLLMYLAKHAARGVAHYQRQIENMPEDWRTRSGRMWGHDAKLPLREQANYECSWEFFWKYRRLVKRWCIAQARSMTDPDKRRHGIAAARHMLRCGRPDMSPHRGVSQWVNEDVATQLMASIPAKEVWNETE
jgi:hypothetical protein